MPSYIFILGRQPQLSIAEIKAVLPMAKIGQQSEDYVLIDSPAIDAVALLSRLGGTIKIATVIGRGDDTPAIVTDLQAKSPTSKINFGISFYNCRPDQRGMTIKTILKNQGISSRLVVSREPILSSVVVKTNKCHEYLVVANKWIGRTEAVQPFEAYGQRDFGRPARDTVSGTLPPKLAQMMLNLAGQPMDACILDPFCGSGTMLQEAALLGYRHIIGTDFSEKAIADTQKNLLWLGQQRPELDLKHVKAFQNDVRQLTKHIPAGSVDAVVTEPYLGPPFRGGESFAEIEAVIQELTDLYTPALQQMATVLKHGGRIVIIIPAFKTDQGIFDVPIDSFITWAGLQRRDNGTLTYHRADQKVWRRIMILER